MGNQAVKGEHQAQSLGPAELVVQLSQIATAQTDLALWEGLWLGYLNAGRREDDASLVREGVIRALKSGFHSEKLAWKLSSIEKCLLFFVTSQ